MLTWVYLLSKLPLRALHWLGAALGLASYALSPSYRQRMQANAQLAGYSSHALHRASAMHAGKMVAELPYLWFRRHAPFAHQHVQARGWASVEKALARGKGIVFLTPHSGCFEVAAQYFAQLAPITVLYRPPKNAAVRALVESGRAQTNLRTAPATLAGVRDILRALKKCEAVGLLPDQVPQAGEGVFAPFFGAPAWTMTLPAKLAHATGAAVVLALSERLPGGAGYVLHFSEFTDELSRDAQVAAGQINAAMERLIRQCPEQYLWGYNRYKRPTERAA
jgi:Kdo2-lipid IVA lauroyltransferase/acyltransferase